MDEEVHDVIQRIGLPSLHEPKLSLKDVMKIQKQDLELCEQTGVVHLLSKLVNFDTGGRDSINIKHKKEILSNKLALENQGNSLDPFAMYLEPDIFSEAHIGVVHSVDVTCLCLWRSDPFLQQEILSKMASCRLAVPLLLPDITDNSVVFLLWGLSSIIKSWKCKETVFEEFAVNYPMPLISFLRYGDIDISKANVINKTIALCHGYHGEHPYIVSREQDSGKAKWSSGMLEIVWVLPDDTDSASKEIFSIPMAFCNLRGDAKKHQSQEKFACLAGDVIIVFVQKHNLQTMRLKMITLSNKQKKPIICIVVGGSGNKRVNEIHNYIKIIDMGNLSAKDLGKIVCRLLKHCLAQNPYTFRSLNSLVDICSPEIKIDKDCTQCIIGSSVVNDIIYNSTEIDNFRQRIFPLTTKQKYWKAWTDLDKQESRNKAWVEGESIQHWIDEIGLEKTNIRKLMSEELVDLRFLKFVEYLRKSSEVEKAFMLSHMQINLDMKALSMVKPFHKEIMRLKSKEQAITQELKCYHSDLTKDDLMSQNKISNMEKERSEIIESINTTALNWEKNTLKLQHFLREIGQTYEVGKELGKSTVFLNGQYFDLPDLTEIGAQMLLNGYPLEILDGDSLHVPLTWIEGVLDSIGNRAPDARVYILSVIGIQSSGKSTLLNCMFGTRFPVSAGRCTRGVSMQLVAIDNECSEEIGCHYLVVIDTEGLRSPERSSLGDYHGDNELATFSICLADMTLVNICGQTISQDMLDILQIAAHAFIRMSEVNLKCECRFVQQNVGDVTAFTRNAYGMQEIMTHLDEAIATAAKQECLHHKYRRFSDVYNVKIDPDLQFIASLWTGIMTPPSQKYSYGVRKLKRAILSELCGREYLLTISEFKQRIHDVWIAVKREDFIFHFQNSNHASQYNKFYAVYTQWRWNLRMIAKEWELDAVRKIEASLPSRCQSVCEDCIKLLDSTLTEYIKLVKEKITKYVTETVADKDLLRKCGEKFDKDLDTCINDIHISSMKMMQDKISSIKRKDNVQNSLPQIKNDITTKVQGLAQNLLQSKQKPSENCIREIFSQKWTIWLTEIEENYCEIQTIAEIKIVEEFETIIMETFKDSSLSNLLRIKIQEEKKLHHTEKHKAVKELKRVKTFKFNLWAYEAENKLRAWMNGQLRNSEISFRRDIVKNIVEKSMQSLHADKSYNKPQVLKVKILINICRDSIQMLEKKHDAHVKKQRCSMHSILELERKYQLMRLVTAVLNTYDDAQHANSFYSDLISLALETIKAGLSIRISKDLPKTHTFLSNKHLLIAHTLVYIGKQEQFKPIIQYLKQPFNVISEYIENLVPILCCESQNDGNESFISSIIESEVDRLQEILENSIEGLSEDTNWLSQFKETVQNQSKMIFGDYNLLKIFPINNVKVFKDYLLVQIQSSLKKDIHVKLNTPNDATAMKTFLYFLPRPLSEDIMKNLESCLERCPFCGSPCDETLGHTSDHSAKLHYPDGLNGWRWATNNELSIEICTSNVASNAKYMLGHAEEYKPYKNYKDDFPDWDINASQEKEPALFWKWVFKTYNEELAATFDADPANIPTGWEAINKDEAINSLNDTYGII